MAPDSLRVQLDCELPSELSVGLGTALFVCGWCFSPASRIRALSLEVGGERQPTMAHGMPRLDPLLALDDPRSYRSGFWGIARIPPEPHAVREIELRLRAELEGGRELSAGLARIRLAPAPQPLPLPLPERWPKRGARVAICMATFNPPPDLLRRQIESIRAQTHDNWVCVISDDCSNPSGVATIEEAIDGDRRFVLTRAPKRLGFYANFERALALAPPDAEFVALSDQDDFWYADKLTTLLAERGRAQLVYSDARVVRRDGEVISETWWGTRANNHSDLTSLLVANAVTGAASLFRRDLLDYALPFPPGQFAHFHDHWLGLVALALGDIAYVDRPLYDYVQHGGASLGHAAANRMASLRDRLRHRRELRERVRLWRLHYFVDVCRILQFATILRMRCGSGMSLRKRRALDRFLASDRSPAMLVRLGVRGARELTGTPETLGAEWMLMWALVWRRLLAMTARERPQSHLRLDALPPPTLVQPPGRPGMHVRARAVAEKIEPLRWQMSRDAPERVNVLIPTFDLRHLFGGYIAKLNLASRLAERGLRVRVITVDPVGPLPVDWRQTVESFSGLEGLMSKVEVAFGREAASIEVSSSDSFVASTWWTAHVAAHALEVTGGDRFLYLIQEYEPFTFPMGTYAALASQSYRFPHFALFSSELLRGYFRAHRIGVFEAGLAEGEAASLAFENAITPVDPPTVEELARRERFRLLFYARPEPHAARNMFELGLLALAGAVADGTLSSDWELRGIGTVERARSIALGGGATLELLPRADQRAYAGMVRDHDVGLALMYTPHPSLVPIEMASAGLLTVTNSFENKTPGAMSAISANLITAEPTVEAVAAALGQACAGASDLGRRVAGSDVRWSRDWNQSFGTELLERVVSVLQPTRSGRVSVSA